MQLDLVRGMHVQRSNAAHPIAPAGQELFRVPATTDSPLTPGDGNACYKTPSTEAAPSISTGPINRPAPQPDRPLISRNTGGEWAISTLRSGSAPSRLPQMPAQSPTNAPAR